MTALAVFGVLLSLFALLFALVNYSWFYHERRAYERHVQELERRAVEREMAIRVLQDRLQRRVAKEFAAS